MKALPVLCFFFSPLAMFAQSKRYLKAEAYLKNREYKHALEYYQICSPKDSVSPNKIAYCQMMAGDPESAEATYQNSLNASSVLDSNVYHYALVLKRNLKYDKAKMWYVKLQEQHPGNKHLAEQVLSCDSAATWQARSSEYTLENCTKINSEFSDATAIPHQGGLVFSSNREEVIIRKKSDINEEPYYNLFFAKFDSTHLRFNYPSLFSAELNTPEHEISPAFSSDGQQVFFTNCKENLNLNKNYSRKLKLYAAEKKNNRWEKPHTFIFNDSSCSYGHPFMEKSGKMFFFASDMKGGFGGVDIYVCLNIDNKWTNPINLGASINTPGNELYPFYHSDSTFYFSSDYHTGMGGFDIFQAKEFEGEWVGLKNMGAPFNSADDDFGFYLEPGKRYGFLSSNRSGGQGKEDLYLVKKRVLE